MYYETVLSPYGGCGGGLCAKVYLDLVAGTDGGGGSCSDAGPLVLGGDGSVEGP